MCFSVLQRLLAVDDDDDFKDMPPSGDGVLGGPEAYADDNEAFRVKDVGEALAGSAGTPATDYGSYGSAAYSAAPKASYAAPHNGHYGTSVVRAIVNLMSQFCCVFCALQLLVALCCFCACTGGSVLTCAVLLHTGMQQVCRTIAAFYAHIALLQLQQN